MVLLHFGVGVCKVFGANSRYYFELGATKVFPFLPLFTFSQRETEKLQYLPEKTRIF